MLRLIRKNFSHGIHPPHHKMTTDRAIRRFPFAPRLIVPLSQHIGKPAVALVRRGQEVVRGEPIARADGFLSVPMHAPATGVVEAIDLVADARGNKAPAIIIKPYPGDDQRVRYGAPRDVDALSPQEIIAAVQESGIVGMGGAAFPTHAKLTIPEGHRIDTLVVNGCECEPFLTNDDRVMVEQAEHLLHGIRLAMRACGAERAIVGIEDNKPKAIAALQAYLHVDDRVWVKPIATKYPQGAEKMLIMTLLHREVPCRGFPYQVGVVVQNIGTLAEIGRLLPLQQGLIERVVTITGDVAHPGNFLVPLGTPLRYVLEQAGFHEAEGEVILGGPLMGNTVASLDVPVTKGVSGILVLSRDWRKDHPRKVQPCIQCGVCVRACPMHLNPSQLGLLAAKREYRTMAERFHLDDCFECGCCTYVCPSNIPLVQYFRIAKQMNREQAA
jgi:electron transport complex protein RnfC